MNAVDSRRGFASRPSTPERWVEASDASSRNSKSEIITARLTVDVTPALRGRIKIIAFQRGLTMSCLLRDLLAREFPETARDQS